MSLLLREIIYFYLQSYSTEVKINLLLTLATVHIKTHTVVNNVAK